MDDNGNMDENMDNDGDENDDNDGDENDDNDGDENDDMEDENDRDNENVNNENEDDVREDEDDRDVDVDKDEDEGEAVEDVGAEQVLVHARTSDQVTHKVRAHCNFACCSLFLGSSNETSYSGLHLQLILHSCAL
jgi:hypothetical protein